MTDEFTLAFVIDPDRVFSYAENQKEIATLSKQQLLSETEAFMSNLKEEWQRNESLALSELERITGIRLRGHFGVFVIHPKSDAGHVHDERSFVWGYGKLSPLFCVYGIAHELLHCVTDELVSNFSKKDQLKFHAIIHLSADEELRCRLLGSSKYFDVPFLKKYDPALISQARKLLPAWREFLINREGTILDFAKRCGIVYP